MCGTLVFDLDGTLVHSAPDICAAANHALEPFCARALNVDEVGLMIGNGLPKLLERAFAAVGTQSDQRQFDETYEVFMSYYKKHPTVWSKLYPDTREVLEAFIGEGFRLCVCTNKLEAIAIDVLEGMNIRQLFSSVVGGANGRARKPDPGVSAMDCRNCWNERLPPSECCRINGGWMKLTRCSFPTTRNIRRFVQGSIPIPEA